MLLKALKMQFDGFLNELNNFCSRFTNGNTSRKVWYLSTKTFWALFYDNCVFHMSILLKSGLFQNIFKRAVRHIQEGLTCNGNGARFLRVVKLAMAAFHSCLFPTILSKLFNDVSDFHLAFLARVSLFQYHCIPRVFIGN